MRLEYDPAAERTKLTALRAKLAAFVEMLAETALTSAALDKLTTDEKTALRKTVERLRGAVEEIEKVIAEHPHASVQAHALTELWGALGAAFLIGNRATLNPISERLDHQDKIERAAKARRAKVPVSALIDQRIVDSVARLPKSSQVSAGAMAKALHESGALIDFTDRVNTLEKRITQLIKCGRIAKRPTIVRTAGNPSD